MPLDKDRGNAGTNEEKAEIINSAAFVLKTVNPLTKGSVPL
jgi:hypothetical protein